MAIRISIIEDDDWIRENLATQIGGTGGFQCVGKFRSAEEALDQIGHSVPDVILLDINLPKMNGIKCARKLKTLAPTAQILMLTVYEDSERIFKSLLAGASGYLLKRTPPGRDHDGHRRRASRQLAHDRPHRAQGCPVFQPARQYGEGN